MFGRFFQTLYSALTGLSWKQWLLMWFLGVGLAALGWWVQWEVPILSPLTENTTFRFLTGQEPPTSNGKVVYGFLPYWNLDDTTIQPELTHLAYFSLGINGDGSIRLRNEDGYLEPGYNRLGSDEFFEMTRTHNGQVELVFTQFNNDDIANFILSQKAHDTFIESLDSLLLAYPVSGINIDIEYTGETTDKMRERFVEFMAQLNNHLDQRYEHIELSIDMYASAADSYNIWDVPQIAAHVDYIVVMAYDFHRRSSIIAGPVAPLFGGKDLWDSDISDNLQAFLQDVPSQKILLGIPFYGYEWQTTSRESQAHTFPDTGATASYKRVLELLDRQKELQVQEHWNEEALSPYISYVEGGEIYVVYYENSRSISYKLDFVNQLNLGGIAIWALGYEGNSRELWEVIDRKL